MFSPEVRDKSLLLWTIPTLAPSGVGVAVGLSLPSEVQVVDHGAKLLLLFCFQVISSSNFHWKALLGLPSWVFPFQESPGPLQWRLLCSAAQMLHSFLPGLGLACPLQPCRPPSIGHISACWGPDKRSEGADRRLCHQLAFQQKGKSQPFQASSHALICTLRSRMLNYGTKVSWGNAIKKPGKPFWVVEGFAQAQQSLQPFCHADHACRVDGTGAPGRWERAAGLERCRIHEGYWDVLPGKTKFNDRVFIPQTPKLSTMGRVAKRKKRELLMQQ